MAKQTITSAVATVVIRISDLGTWGENCTTKQVHEQASEVAISRIRQALSGKAILVSVDIEKILMESK